MFGFIVRRVLYMFVVLIAVSIISYVIIELPPGDYMTSYIAQLKQSGGGTLTESQIASLRKRYGLDLPLYQRYLKWMGNMLQGDLGRSFQLGLPVWTLLRERLPTTVMLSLATIVFSYAVAIPLGIYSAVHQYSFGDYVLTTLGFLGVATPSFLLALIVMFGLNRYFGLSIGGLFSPQYAAAPWSWGKLLDLLKHLPAPILVIGLSSLAWLIRVMRGTMLDELNRPYVAVARAKGLKENKLLWKYPVRIAINPLISTIGYSLPAIFSGSTIVSIVLSIPTIGPLLFGALVSQDSYLAGSCVFALSGLTVIGNLMSDILLAYADPRIRLVQ